MTNMNSIMEAYNTQSKVGIDMIDDFGTMKATKDISLDALNPRTNGSKNGSIGTLSGSWGDVSNAYADMLNGENANGKRPSASTADMDDSKDNTDTVEPYGDFDGFFDEEDSDGAGAESDGTEDENVDMENDIAIITSKLDFITKELTSIAQSLQRITSSASSLSDVEDVEDVEDDIFSDDSETEETEETEEDSINK